MISSLIAIIGIGLLITGKLLWFFHFKKYYYTKYNIPLYTTSFEYSYRKCKVPLLKVRFGKTFVYLLLDTGSNLNFLTSNFFHKHINQFKPTENTPLKIYSSSAIFGTNQQQVTTSFRHKHFKFQDTDFVVLPDIEESLAIISQTLGEPVVGILGAPFMKHAKMTIDLNRDILLIKVK